MARLYAQLCTLVFGIVGIGGLLLGDAGSRRGGVPAGNFDGVQLQLTWGRDVLDIALAAVFAYVGFFAARRPGRILVLAAGLVLLALAAIGFRTGVGGWASLHFPVAMNVFDLVTGLLAVLAALGTVEDGETVP